VSGRIASVCEFAACFSYLLTAMLTLYPAVQHSSLVDQLTHAEQEYVRRAEEKVLQLELGTTSDGRPGVHVLGGKSKEVVVPTTEELSAYVHDQEALARIKSLRASAMQQADEKVAIAEQTHSIIDATVERLDSDIAVLEKCVNYSSDVCQRMVSVFLTNLVHCCFAL
jgi:hypothetical protein